MKQTNNEYELPWNDEIYRWAQWCPLLCVPMRLSSMRFAMKQLERSRKQYAIRPIYYKEGVVLFELWTEWPLTPLTKIRREKRIESFIKMMQKGI